MPRFFWLLLAGALVLPGHVGSPDIFFEGKAGPYPLFITIRPPVVIPGTAEVEIRVRSRNVTQVRIAPQPISGPGARFAPAADVAQQSKDDPQFFTGALWMMTSGSWQVKVAVDGPEGKGEMAVPVPALASRTLGMQSGLAVTLSILTLVLALGAISIAGAAAREAQLHPGEEPATIHRRKARIAMAMIALAVAAILFRGNIWWNAEARNYSRIIYKPLAMKASLAEGGVLRLELENTGWLARKVDDFLPDHGHLMHMYVLRLPEMERVWHLHPEMTAAGVFTHALPPMPAGRYALYSDVVHENGLPETMVAEMDFPEIQGQPLSGDDSTGSGKPAGSVFPLPDGARMIWERELDVYPVKRAHVFRFRVETADGKPARDMELYMGMPGHAAFVKLDRTVFAHVHPSGSIPMAALNIVQPDPHAGHTLQSSLPPDVSFPYGFPQPGEYRIFVQAKRAGKVQMGMFKVQVR
ncbi:MAG TPA: hypothetical protein VM120_20745 [Bryobacteraceae bacterium]|nr:hypothetical protein [Bryobacteraceae bacterium]